MRFLLYFNLFNYFYLTQINKILSKNLIMRLIIFISTLFLFNISFGQEQNCDIAKRKYLLQNPDVAKAGMDAWNHYEIFGKKEGRKWPDCNVEKTELSKIIDNEKINSNNNIASIKFEISEDFASQKKIIDKKILDYAALKKSEDSLIDALNLYKHPFNCANSNELIIDTSAYFFLMNKNNVVFVLKNNSDVPYYKKIKKILKYLPDITSLGNNISLDDLIIFQNLKGNTVFNNEKGFTWITGLDYHCNFEFQDWSDRKKNYERAAKQALPIKTIKEITLYNQKLKEIGEQLTRDRKVEKNVWSIIKKYKEIITLQDQDRPILAKKLTGVDEHYLLLLKQQKMIQNKINEITNLHVVKLNSNYLYFGEKSGNAANGFGYLISKAATNTPIVMVAKWQNGYPSKIMETYLYSDMHKTGDSPSLEIRKSNSNDRIIIDKNGLIAGNHNGNTFNGTDVFSLWNNGNYFMGTYENGNRTYGLYGFKSGEKYLGSFDSEGKYSGTGKLYWTSGTYYEGQWSNNQRNGYGKLVDNEGSVSEGIWQDDVLIKSKETIAQENREAEERRVEQEKLRQEEERKRQQEVLLKEKQDLEASQLFWRQVENAMKNPTPEKKGKKTCKCCGKTFNINYGWGYDSQYGAVHSGSSEAANVDLLNSMYTNGLGLGKSTSIIIYCREKCAWGCK